MAAAAERAVPGRAVCSLCSRRRINIIIGGQRLLRDSRWCRRAAGPVCACVREGVCGGCDGDGLRTLSGTRGLTGGAFEKHPAVIARSPVVVCGGPTAHSDAPHRLEPLWSPPRASGRERSQLARHHTAASSAPRAAAPSPQPPVLTYAMLRGPRSGARCRPGLCGGTVGAPDTPDAALWERAAVPHSLGRPLCLFCRWGAAGPPWWWALGLGPLWGTHSHAQPRGPRPNGASARGAGKRAGVTDCCRSAAAVWPRRGNVGPKRAMRRAGKTETGTRHIRQERAHPHEMVTEVTS